MASGVRGTGTRSSRRESGTPARGPKAVGTLELVRAFELARDTKVKTIALTQTESPVAKAAEIVVPIDLPEGNNIYRPTSTRIAYIAMVDILASLVAYAVQPKATVTLRRIKQQLVLHRDGDDRQLLGD